MKVLIPIVLIASIASASPPQLLGTAAWPMTEQQYAVLAAVDPDLAEVWAGIASLLTECVNAANYTCGAGHVCWVCVYENSCSYGCGNPLVVGGCAPVPPCGPPAGIGGGRSAE